MINCEKQLDLRWTKSGVKSKLSRTAVLTVSPPNPSKFVAETTGTTFQINGTILHVPIVTLSINDDSKFLENIM